MAWRDDIAGQEGREGWCAPTVRARLTPAVAAARRRCCQRWTTASAPPVPAPACSTPSSPPVRCCCSLAAWLGRCGMGIAVGPVFMSATKCSMYCLGLSAASPTMEPPPVWRCRQRQRRDQLPRLDVGLRQRVLGGGQPPGVGLPAHRQVCRRQDQCWAVAELQCWACAAGGLVLTRRMALGSRCRSAPCLMHPTTNPPAPPLPSTHSARRSSAYQRALDTAFATQVQTSLVDLLLASCSSQMPPELVQQLQVSRCGGVRHGNSGHATVLSSGEGLYDAVPALHACGAETGQAFQCSHFSPPMVLPPLSWPCCRRSRPTRSRRGSC